MGGRASLEERKHQEGLNDHQVGRVRTAARFQQPSVICTVCRLPVTSACRVERWRSEKTLPGKLSLAPCGGEASSPHAFFMSVSQLLCRGPGGDSVPYLHSVCESALEGERGRKAGRIFLQISTRQKGRFSQLSVCQAISLSFSQENLASTSGAIPPFPHIKAVEGCTRVSAMPMVTKPFMLSLQVLGCHHSISRCIRLC